MSNDEIAKRVTRGTTTPWTKVQVLFNDGTHALVKWPGDSREKVSPWVEQYLLSKIHDKHGSGRTDTVWRSDVNGRLTKNRIEALVKSLRLNPECIQEVERVVARKRRTTTRSEKTRKDWKAVLDTGCVQVLLWLWGEYPDDWLDILYSANIVASVADAGSQPSGGDYVLLEYDTMTDCMEFIRADREKILDDLEKVG